MNTRAKCIKCNTVYFRKMTAIPGYMTCPVCGPTAVIGDKVSPINIKYKVYGGQGFIYGTKLN